MPSLRGSSSSQSESTKDAERGTRWQSRIDRAEEYFLTWKNRFNCEELENYYEGFQWGEALPSSAKAYQPYVVNLVYSTIKVRRPTLLFRRPSYNLEPEPNQADFNPEEAWQVTQLQQDTLNTIVAKPYLNFAEHLELSILDAWFYFGVIEVGFAASYIENPNALRPSFADDAPAEENPAKLRGSVEYLPASEQIFTKRIPAHRFRVGGNVQWEIEKCGWCGYYEYFSRAEILAPNSGFKNTDQLVLTSASTKEDETFDDATEEMLHGDQVKVWKIWDIQRRNMLMIVADTNTIIYERTFNRIPFKFLRFDKRRTGWYPLPPVFQWISSQDEQNEAKEQVRAARRRAKRAYQAVIGRVKDEELEKFAGGADGVIVMVSSPDAIQPIMNPALDSSIAASLQISKDDFNLVSGVSNETRGVADRQTATQSNIIEQKSVIRETDERETVAEWACAIGKEILLQARESYSEPIWIKLNLDTGAFGQDYEQVKQQYKKINPITDLGQLNEGSAEYIDDFNVSISVESLSPIVTDKEKQTYMEFLAVMQNYPIIALNPLLIRETAYRLGYRNEKVIMAFQQAALLQMAGQIGQSQGQEVIGKGSEGGPPAGSNMAQQTAEQMQPPTQGEIEQQLGQVGVPQ